MVTSAPTFRAAVVAPLGEEVAQFGYWCPWCEAVHVHGLADMTPAEARGKTESRAAHCLPRRSPIAGKDVDLIIDRVVRSWTHLEPRGPFVDAGNGRQDERMRLGAVLNGGRLGSDLLGHLFGDAAFQADEAFEVAIAGGWVQVRRGGDHWSVENEHRDILAEGRGLGRLLTRLFGVPIGIVAVRVLEDALGLDLPADARIALASFVDRACSGLPVSDEKTEEACR